MLRFRIACAVVVFIFSLSAQSENTALTGFLVDTLCGAKGATERHVECAKRTVASGKAKYALYDEREKKLYILEPQESAEAWLGQRVKITGTLAETPVKRAGEKLDPLAPLGTGAATEKVVRHSRVGTATDHSTPVAGLLKVSTIEPASPPHG